MKTNTRQRRFDVVQITNELPFNRTGGVGTVIENLMSGLPDLAVLWFLIDHGYAQSQIAEALARYPNVAFGDCGDLGRFRAPVFHLHAYQENAGLYEFLSARTTVCTIHSLLALEERSNDVKLGRGTAWQEQLIAASTVVVLVSEAERRQYAELGYQRLNPRVRVIHNGLRAPPAYRAPRGKAVLGYCGRLVPRKHPEYVQLVLNEPGFADMRTLIAGRGFSRYACRLLREHGLSERVRFLGWCAGARLESFFEAIDVLAVPSIYEPFGLAALEAAARGIPVVCTRVDGLVEVLGEHAFYCEDTGYPAFREAISRWAASGPAELSALARAARRRYRARFTDRAMGRAYRSLFAELGAG